MKWCFLINDVDLLMEFLGKLCHHLIEEGDECLLVFNSNIAQYHKRKYFPGNARVISKVDWLAQHYRKKEGSFQGISWRDFFPTFERKKRLLHLDYAHCESIISQACQFFDFLFSNEKPDIIISEPPANIFTNVAYQFCVKHGCRYMGIIDSRIQGRVDVFDKEHTFSRYKETFKNLNVDSVLKPDKKFAEDFIDNFLEHKKLPSNIDYQINVERSIGLARYLKRIMQSLPFWLRYLRIRPAVKRYDYETEMRLAYEIHRPIDAAIRAAKRLFSKGAFSKVNDQDDYFLFPLHFYPEASVLMWATYYADQLATIKNVAFSLPFPYKLYVKEHPMSLGLRPFGFYQELRKIPNVVLIHPGEKVKSLVQKSMGVITLTSTLGLEAALLGKPVYVMGNVFYEYHPKCQKVRNFDELREKLAHDLKRNFEKNDTENINFIVSYFKNTIEATMYIDETKHDPNNYVKICNSLKRFF